ncbi:hypothetical protein ACN08Y_10140 [Rothia sp. P5764]|uniref:hypothetical protein n=1 Tax=Rothia sp. P5764 TaxID=3402654 RepID=UPI003ACBD45A
METIYRIEATLEHGMSGWPREEVKLTGTWGELMQELETWLGTGLGRTEYEVKETKGYTYWDEGIGDFDPDDPESMAEATAQGWIYDENEEIFVRAQRRERSIEALHAWACECLKPDSKGAVEVTIVSE